ncbi:MAG TPA: mannitol dehydrogenase family protein [Micrococcaceae bacterium]|nr:mannitol dehydrogenase family protein [Micrococcaceae bacterium]
MSLPLLNRTNVKDRPAAPVRIVHLGLGAFHRAHQAWYTQQADPEGAWGIAAFTGRRPDAAVALGAQDGLYTLIERSDGGDSFELVGSIVEARDGADVARLAELVAAESTALVTLTITETAYGLGPDGTLDPGDPAVAADIGLLASGAGREGRPTTAIGRLVWALAARRRAGAGGIAIVSCDNLANNAAAARAAIRGMAAAADPELAAWMDTHVSFVGTSVDRITPRTTPAEIELVARATGFQDDSPVVAEPFRNWILSGSFPSGRPDWERAGAVFVEDIEPYENRKLWLLNGAHSLLAYAGTLKGHETVAQAVADPECAQWIADFWDEAQANLPAGLDIPAYRAALLERFGNSRIAHYLAQIAMDGSSKLRMRALPVLRAERAAGRSGAAAARMVGAWIAFLRSAAAAGRPVQDGAAERIAAALALPTGQDTAALIGLLDPMAAGEAAVVELIECAADSFAAAADSFTASAGS